MDFNLVDLDAQADAVARHVKGWKVVDILNWMKLYGTVEEVINPYDDRLYLFSSREGIRTGFSFTANGELVIVRGHTTYQPR